MKNAIWALGIVLGLGLATGCTPSPEKVCGHLEELQDKQEKDDDKELKGEAKKLYEKLKEKARKQCPKEFAALKEADADVYKCAAKCVMDAKDMDAVEKCDDKCDGLKEAYKKARKKAAASEDDEEETEKASKKKKASDDDDDDSDKKSKKKKKKKADDDDDE